MRKAPPPKRKPATTRTSRRPRSSARGRPPRRRKRSSEARAGRVAYLGLGSNLGNRRGNLHAALAALAAASRVERVSSLYSTEPVGFADQPDFYNLVARVRWRGTPQALLALALRIEEGLGRVRGRRNGPRVIDIDLLDVGGAVRRERDPTLPHPRLHRRRFVLVPLAEIAPDWRHPVTGRSVEELLAKLPARPGVRRLRRGVGSSAT